ncbi:G-protein coupled receptor protein-like protein [Leptotrombidium deliense]|uniref:G-protein coupled receptor protein-like protein n=1 Tax=Leptotrombidium deliense TaxID=299467 RepID=A0A443SHF3_9ACAR|nr:G-protein coupled receptor protein-like protein [Leptotrombidium deliense]
MKRRCRIPATIDYFGDPCPETHKYLEVQYQCLPDLPKKRPQGFSVTHKQQLQSAIVRSDNKNRIDSRTSIESDNTHNDSSLSIPATEKRFRVNAYDATNEPKNRTTTIAVATHKTESAAEENGIQVVHPQSARAMQVSQTNETRTDNVSKSRTSWTVSSSSSTQQWTYTKAISESTEVLSTQSPLITTSMTMFDATSHCAPTESRNLTWNWTEVGQPAIQTCPSGSRGVARWLCVTDANNLPVWSSEEADLSDCTSHWVLLLEDTMNKDDLSVTNLAMKLSRMTKIKTLYGGDIYRITDIVSHLVVRMEAILEEFSDYRSRNQFVKDVLDSIQESCNNLFEDFQRNSWLDLPAKQRNEVATHLINALERTSALLSETSTANSDYNRIMSNIYVGVHTRISKDTNEGIELPFISVNSAVDSNTSETTTKYNYLLSSNRVYLPSETLKKAEKDSVIRITMTVYSKLDALFVPNKDSFDSIDEDDVNATTIVNSNIVGLMLNKEGLPMLSKVRLTFKHLVTTNVTDPKCVHWNIARMKWTSNGCEVISWNRSHTTCECNHLTNFAVLMQIRDVPVSVSHETTFKIITVFGCSVSAFCLLFTFAILALCKNVKGDRIAIHMNLCLCLLVGELVFLFGITQTETIMLCRIVALVLHYIFLCAFLWMFFEGFQLYVMLIEAFESEKSRLRYYYLIAYGLPSLIVLVCVYLDPYSYGTVKHCWLRNDNYFILSFIIPVIAVLIAILAFKTITVYVLRNLISSLPSVTSNKDENKIKNIRHWFRESLILVVLIGFSFTVRVSYLWKSHIEIALLFMVFNCTQSVYILISTLVHNKKIVEKYWNLFTLLRSKTSFLDASGSESNSSAILDISRRKHFLGFSNANLSFESSPSNSQVQENPIIPANCASALTPTIRRLTTSSGQKYFVTGHQTTVDRRVPQENEYGFRHVRQSNMVPGSRSRKNCGHILNNQFVEHVYECIDDDPYIAILFTGTCQMGCNQNTFEYGIRNDFRPQDHVSIPNRRLAELRCQDLILPAIIRDCNNT